MTDKTKKETLVTYYNPNSIISEQYRLIRTNLLLSLEDLKNRVILITSPSSGEGKSTTAVNIAISMALQKENILLIDGNLRKPVLHSLFNISNDVGLTNILTENTPLEETIHHTEIGRLDILPSGSNSVNPAELLGSQRMHDLIKKLSQSYNMIFIDTPSVLEATDTILLAKYCDGIIMVLNPRITGIQEAMEAKKGLEFAKATFVGAIYNEN